MDNTLKQHWDSKYQHTEQKSLGWYEENPQPSLNLIKEFSVSKADVILDVGSGSSTLIDHLIQEGYSQIIATDISAQGLAITQKRLGDSASQVRFVVDDLTAPAQLDSIKNISIWHDRAVLHFFTEEKDQKLYVRLLNSILKPGGFALISTFAKEGLTKCSGLDIRQYDEGSMVKLLGDEFKLIRSMPYTYQTTWGQERPFIYVIFQRI